MVRDDRLPAPALSEAVAASDAPDTDIGALRLWLGTVAEITRASTQSFELAELLNLIAEGVCRLTRQDLCSLMLAQPEQDKLTIEGWYGLSDEYVQRVNTELTIRIRPGPFGEGPSSRAFRSQQPVQIRDTTRDVSFTPWQDTALEFGYRAVLAVPLIASTGVVGVLNTYTFQPHQFSTEEVALLETFANLAAIAIDSAKLRDRGRETIRGLEGAKLELETLTAELERSDEVHRELMQVVLADTPMDVILSALADALAADARLEDHVGEVLATANHGDVGDGVAVVGTDRAAATTFSDAAWDERAPVRWELHDRRGLVLPINVAGQPTAQLWLEPTDPTAAPLPPKLAERAGVVIAFQLLKQQSADDVEARLSRDVLGDLLIVDDADGFEALCARASHLGYQLAAPHQLLVIAVDDQPAAGGRGSRVSPRRLLSFIRTLATSGSAPRALVSSRAEQIIVLWPEGSLNGDAIDFARRLQRAAPVDLAGSTLSIAIGGVCQDRGDHAAAFQLAKGALQLAPEPGQLLTPQELGVYRFLLQVRQPRELIEFAQTLLEPVHEYDRIKGPVLLPTLRTYVAEGNAVTRAAERLHVHPNTVTYRLRKIEELIGRQLSRASDLLDVQFALKILDVFGED